MITETEGRYKLHIHLRCIAVPRNVVTYLQDIDENTVFAVMGWVI